MPVRPTYPGVYVEEIPSGVRTITGVATSITAFIGRAKRGPVNVATTIESYADFERTFGGLWDQSTLGYAVRDFYLNGGTQAIIVRLFQPDLQQSAQQVLDAINASKGTTPTDIAKDGRTSADTIKKAKDSSDADKTAAEAVAAAAETAAKDKNATADTVKAAAVSAAQAQTASGRARLTVGGLVLEAGSDGTWGNKLRMSVDTNNISASVAHTLGIPQENLFNLNVYDGDARVAERFINVTVAPGVRQVDKVLLNESRLIRAVTLPSAIPTMTAQTVAAGSSDGTSGGSTQPTPPAGSPGSPGSGGGASSPGGDVGGGGTAQPAPPSGGTATATKAGPSTNGKPPKVITDPFAPNSAVTIGVADADKVFSDGRELSYGESFAPDGAEANKLGLYALEQADLFNLLCIPPYKFGGEGYDIEYAELVDDAIAYCQRRRAFFIIDSPHDWRDKETARTKFTDPGIGTPSEYAALFFPRIIKPNPLHNNQMEEFATCGLMAGIFARTDAQRGVWKAPAGLDANLVGVPQLTVNLTDLENGELNQLGINCLRAFPIYGRVSWGARTLRGADQFADEYKYIPVRRTALYIEESLYRGTQWVVFEPNDEPLWAQIRLNVGAFMHNLFRKGAFQGKTLREAYLVKCDSETTTQHDIDLGIVNILVGFAPLKPAEFVIISIQQLAGQIQV